MITVICCVCDRAVYRKPGNGNAISHGFCQACLDEYCEENGIESTEISIPKGAVVNYECFPEKSPC